MARHYHVNNGGTNLTTNTSAGATTSPVNAVPSITVPFYAVFDATNINNKYEVVEITGKTATNINHAATVYDHTIAEEVRFPFVAEEADAISEALFGSGASWTAYTSVTPTTGTLDSPSFPIVFAGVDLTSVISVGMRVKITQSTTKYFIVTAISFSTDTTITLYGGTDYSLVASGTTAISAFSYSSMKAPVGFPLDPTKWTVESSTTTTTTQSSPTQNVWYNIGSFSITAPIGSWRAIYNATVLPLYTANTSCIQYTTLSTANNSESDVDMTTFATVRGASGNQGIGVSLTKEKVLSPSSKTTYYLNHKTDNTTQTSIALIGGGAKAIIRFVCAYL